MSFGVDGRVNITRLRRAETRFLSTGFDGGYSVGEAAYNLTVPEGWGDEGPRDLRAYATERLTRAGFDPTPDAPVLLTGVDQRHARVARLGGVVVLATVGLSNPAALPVDVDVSTGQRSADAADRRDETTPPVGTVNLLVGTTRSLAPGALANLIAVAAEAKATTLLAVTGFPGTTSDAVVVGCATGRGRVDGCEEGAPEPDRKPAPFSGAATPVGAAARACVRDAVLASLRSRYADESIPESVEAAEYGVLTDQRADVSRVDDGT